MTCWPNLKGCAGPNVRTFLRFLTGRKTLLISAPFSRGVMFVFVNVIKPQGLEPLQFPTKFRSPSRSVGRSVGPTRLRQGVTHQAIGYRKTA